MGKQFTNTLYWSGDFIMVFDEMMYRTCFNLTGKSGIEWTHRVCGGIKTIRLAALFLNRADIY